jgi:methionine-rich copper-binding protein CopC
VTIQFNKLPSLRRISGLAILLVLASCTAGDGTGLDAGGRPLPPGPVPNDDFQQIQSTIFGPICSTCHSGANAPQGLRLDAGNSYALLVNVASAEVPALKRVNPGNPDASYLVQKIQGIAAAGVRMPANGPPYLSQTQIDLVRGWIAAGAPQSAAPPDRLVVVSSIPAVAEQAGAGLGKLTIVFNGQVDSSLANGNAFALRDAADQLVTLAGVRVPAGRQNVVEITTAQPLAAGSYQLSVHGDGPAPLADQSGHVLDGDADGKPGGDMLIPFDVTATVNEGTAR